MLAYCERLVVENAGTDERNVIRILAAIATGELKQDLVLQNYYQDVPVSFKARLKSVTSSRAELIVHALQAVVMEYEHTTLIRSAHLPYPVLARVREMDDDSRMATVHQFGYVRVPANDRRHVRVQLAGNDTVTFHNSIYEFQGKIQDISIGGMSVLVRTNEKLAAGTAGELHIELGDIRAAIGGTLTHCTRQGEFEVMHFKLDRGTRFENDISRLINRRQSEIIRDLIKKT